MIRAVIVALLAVALAGCGGGAPTAQANTVQRVAVVGDSLTLRTGLCAPDCPADLALSSYATHLAAASGGAMTLIMNAGRGGDTCTPQAAYTAGPHAGQPRGLLTRLQPVIDARPDLVMVLIGINDQMIYGVSPQQVAQCVVDVRQRLVQAGSAVVVLGYPPMTGSAVFGRRADPAELNAALGVQSTPWPQWAAQFYTVDGVHPGPAGAAALAVQIAARPSIQPEGRP